MPPHRVAAAMAEADAQVAAAMAEADTQVAAAMAEADAARPNSKR